MRDDMTKRPKNEPVSRTIALNPEPKGEFKMFGGSLADDWNMRLLNNVGGSVPVNQSNTKSSNEVITAVCNAMVDMAPADPIEGILIGQIVAANEASLAMYRKGWAQPPEYFTARTKYLQLAEKAARTVVVLTERLDHHRGRGQQQITVKHVTVNADQAVVAENITTAAPALQGNAPVAIEPILQPELVGWGRGRTRNDRQPHAKSPRRSALQSQIKTNREGLPIARG
jgi:hypothetical protein